MGRASIAGNIGKDGDIVCANDVIHRVAKMDESISTSQSTGLLEI